MNRFKTEEGQLLIRNKDGKTLSRPRPITKSYSIIIKHYPGGQDHDQQRHGDWAPHKTYSGDLNEIRSKNVNLDDLDQIAEDTMNQTEEYDTKAQQIFTDYTYQDAALYNGRLRNEAKQWNEPIYDDDYGVPVKENIKIMDKVIAKAPAFFGDKVLYRVVHKDSLEKLEKGDIIEDAGFLSTTVIDLTRGDVKDNGASIQVTANRRPMIILPSQKRDGKGIYIGDISHFRGMEEEVVLPRNSKMKFLGITPTETGPGYVFRRIT